MGFHEIKLGYDIKELGKANGTMINLWNNAPISENNFQYHVNCLFNIDLYVKKESKYGKCVKKELEKHLYNTYPPNFFQMNNSIVVFCTELALDNFDKIGMINLLKSYGRDQYEIGYNSGKEDKAAEIREVLGINRE